MSQVGNVLIAYDSSGSTHACSEYHALTQGIVRPYKTTSNARILSWSSTRAEITFQKLEEINKCKYGSGGTNVDLVAEYILSKDFKGKLVLITDGQVDGCSIVNCDRLLCNYNGLTEVEVHIIGEYANMSVSCPFTRYCPHDVHTYHSGRLSETVTISQEDIRLLNDIDQIQNYDMFVASYDSILKAISARMMGKSHTDIELHDKIVKLKNKIQEEASKSKTKEIDTLITELKETYSLQTYQNIVSYYYALECQSVDKMFQDLLNITKGGLANTFHHRLRRGEEMSEVPIENIPLTENEETFECPISCEDEHDVVLLIKRCEPLFQTLQPNQVEDVLTCPLNALNYPAFVKALEDSFDLAVGLQALQQAQNVNLPITTSPLTRCELLGGFFLGSNRSQVLATNHTVSSLMSGEHKKIGNMDLWYAVIYFVLSKHPRYQDISTFATSHLKWRLENCTTWASLTGLPQYLSVRVPLGLACWMVAASPMLNLPPKRDMMRAHIWHLDNVFNLAQLYGAPIYDECKLHAKRVKTLYKMVSLSKSKEKFSIFRALYQKCHRIQKLDTNEYCSYAIEWIPIDGSADQSQIEEVMSEIKNRYNIEGSCEDLIGLSQLVSPNLSANDIPLALSWKPAKPNHDVYWSFGLSRNTIEGRYDICPKTMRPYYYNRTKKDKPTWKDEYKEIYNTEQIFSGNESYIRHVQKFRTYPTVDELLRYMHFYYCVYRNCPCLPCPVEQFAREVVEEYTSLVKTLKSLSPEDFITITNNSLSVAQRVALEDQMFEERKLEL